MWTLLGYEQLETKARAKQRAKGTEMGRGDTKSAQGKIFKGSFGKWRPKTKKKNVPKKDAGARSGSGSRR